MCQQKSEDVCQHPERLQGKPEDCTPEKVEECRGKPEEHCCCSEKEKQES